jgi:hypothetical protein
MGFAAGKQENAMRIEKQLTPGFTDGTELSRARHGAPEIIHEIRNCMGVVLLTVGSLEAEPGPMLHPSHTIATLEKMVRKMDSLLEELAKSSAQSHPKKTGASRARLVRPHKLPMVTIG